MYDPFDPTTIIEPYPAYTWLRDEAPVYHNEQWDLYAISRYDDVVWALRNYEQLSSTGGVGYEMRPVPMMIALDPPDHTRLRRIVQREFVPKAIDRWEVQIAALADALLEHFLEAGEGDWAHDIAYPFPVQVIADMLGVPAADREQFKAWSDIVLDLLAAGPIPGAERDAMEQAALDFSEYLFGQVNIRREQPADDLLGLLLNPRSGEVLTNFELVAFAMLILVAGHETTTNLLSSMVWLLATHPDQWDALRADRSLVPNAVEEIVRYESPIQGFFRHTLSEVERGGVSIPEGKKVLVLYGSANRDPRHFGEPDRFDVTRSVTNHVAFGAGIHLCLGAPVARLESRLLLERLLDRVERLELAGEPVRRQNPLLRGFEHLPVRVVLR